MTEENIDIQGRMVDKKTEFINLSYQKYESYQRTVRARSKGGFYEKEQWELDPIRVRARSFQKDGSYQRKQSELDPIKKMDPIKENSQS